MTGGERGWRGGEGRQEDKRMEGSGKDHAPQAWRCTAVKVIPRFMSSVQSSFLTSPAPISPTPSVTALPTREAPILLKHMPLPSGLVQCSHQPGTFIRDEPPPALPSESRTYDPAPRAPSLSLLLLSLASAASVNGFTSTCTPRFPSPPT